VKDPLKYLDYQVLLPMIARFPPPLAYRLAEWRGSWRYFARSESRSAAIRNIAGAFSTFAPRQVKIVALRQFQTASVDEMESSWFRKNPEFFERVTSIEGLEELRQAARANRGVLIFLAHWGSPGIMFVALGRKGLKFHVVVRPLNRDQDQLHPAHVKWGMNRFADIEAAAGHPFLLTGQGNFPKMRDLLRNGELLMVPFDVTPQIVRSVAGVQFLGRDAYFPDGIARLHQETGAQVFQSLILRSPHRPYQSIRIREVKLSPGMTSQQIMQKLVGILEEQIISAPGHWTLWDSLEWFYREPDESQRVARRAEQENK
jgi:lauroyl/myristoyl acyltransferase